MKKENFVKKENSFNTFDDVKLSASIMATDIAFVLGTEIEDLNSNADVFKKSLERPIQFMLNMIFKKPEAFLIFPDIIPCFSVIVVRKSELVSGQSEKVVDRDLKNEVHEVKILDSILQKFFKKNQGKVIIIDNQDIIFALLPVGDLKKALKEAEIYVSY